MKVFSGGPTRYETSLTNLKSIENFPRTSKIGGGEKMGADEGALSGL